jgi:hypothetical protein
MSSEYNYKKALQYQGKKVMNRILSNSYLDNSIAVMLDLEGTSNDINSESASIFIKELDTIRKILGAKYCYICLSTHSGSIDKVKNILNCISKFTNKNIIIGRSFLYGSSYDFDSDILNNEGCFFNTNKIETFKKYYLNDNNFNNIWFAIIDDSLAIDTYLKYKDIHPCLFIKPGSNGISCFMNRITSIYGFDGVIRELDGYIKDIKKYNLLDVMTKQIELIGYVSSGDLLNKVYSHDFVFLSKYLDSAYAKSEDYYDIVNWINLIKDDIDESEIDNLVKLFDIINNNLDNKDSLNTLKELELSLKNRISNN